MDPTNLLLVVYLHRNPWFRIFESSSKHLDFFHTRYIKSSCSLLSPHSLFQAPGIGVAELAHMNEYQSIDAVMTNNAEVLMFGARVVIQT